MFMRNGHSLTESYQLSENIRTGKQLAPTFFLHFLTTIALALICLFMVYVLDTEISVYFSIVLFFLFMAVCNLGIVTTTIRYHPILNRRAARLCKRIQTQMCRLKDSQIYAGNHALDINPMPKSISGNSLINKAQINDHFDDLKILLEVDSMIETVKQDMGKNNMNLENYHLSPLIDVAVGSVINQLIFGFRFIGLKALMNEQAQLLVDPATAIILSMPWLRHLPIFSHYYGVFKTSVANLELYFIRQIEATMQKRAREMKESPLDEEDTYFVESFLHEMEQHDLRNGKQQNQIFK
uniref:Uncharacterized protein n=1 Tax=Ditylenchus dipsaci TaxID=166011 RepID=A0A915D575_9BILA